MLWVAKYLEKLKKGGKPEDGDFGGEYDNEYVLTSMMWEDSYLAIVPTIVRIWYMW